MTASDDFFGDSEDTKECSYCGKSSGRLDVTIRDAYGPTHWAHNECKIEAVTKHSKAADSHWYDQWADMGGNGHGQ